MTESGGRKGIARKGEKAEELLTVERWGCLELAFPGAADGNPFTDYTIRGTFQGEQETVETDGFYDGDGVYRIRFMPSFTGEYRYTVQGTFGETKTGHFTVTEAGPGNHGPVRVENQYCFSFADGTPFYPIGTTCYVWELQPDELIEQTLRSLQEARFNKIRFCIFPKHYDYNLKEPRSYPYEGTPMDSSALTRENFFQYDGKTEGNHFDLTRFHPAHFRHIENCILKLQKIGVEADLIVMHPYDRWGFSCMPREADELYWKYVLARFSAFRNVWWAAANEYDLLSSKTEADWEFYGDLMTRLDPYHHLRSIHQCFQMYDHTRPWITHCSIQRRDLYRTAENTDEWRRQYGKPLVLDEIAYEGNIQHGWGNISGEEMNRRFWEGALRGGYPGHGETFLNPEDILWWSHGGRLRGESWKRVGFLLDLLSAVPGNGLKPADQDGRDWDCVHAIPAAAVSSRQSDYHLYYYSFMQPSFRDFHFPENESWRAEVLDTWNMTVEDRGIHQGSFRIELGGKPYMAIRFIRERQG
ncbi:MAG: DUF5605 domain-containing protein [Clostridia bacterium]|nr:DUF5605 domain-containing protein [Clostridia bacterium]